MASTDLYRVFNLTLMTEQNRLLGFGSAGMTQYVDARIPIRFLFCDLNRILQLAAAIVISASITVVSMKLWERKRDRLAQGQEIIVTGEVLDMSCYIAYHLEMGRSTAKSASGSGFQGDAVRIKA